MTIAKTGPNTANITWLPTWAQLGAFAVSAKATDPGNLFDVASFTVTVVNRPPVLNPLADISGGHPTNLISFPVGAFDPDSDDLAFALVAAPAGMTITKTGPNTALVNWTPGWPQIGTYTVTVKVTDPGGLSDVQSCNIMVANQAPVLSPLADVSAHPTRLVNFSVNATDPDNDDLTFALVSAPAGMTILKTGPNTAVVNWTPTWAQLGCYTVAVKVTDPGGLSDVKTCVVTVANQAPVLSPLSDFTTNVGTPVLFTAVAIDPDGDTPLTFSLISPPPGATINNGGVFSWTPTASGAYTIAVRVADPGGLSDVKSCTITVNP
jgi:hypothetical protein